MEALTKPLSDTIANSPILASVKSGAANMTNSVSNMRESVSSGIQGFSSPTNLGETTGEYASSNGLVAKFVFLLLVLIVFVILLKSIAFIAGYWFQPSRSPYLVKGMQTGSTSKTILQDPRNSNSITIYRSNNASKGIEFTWSIWLNIESVPTVESAVFVKGNTNRNGPGLYLNKGSDIVATGTVSTATTSSTTCTVSSISGTFAVGSTITGNGIPTDTKITGVNGNAITMDKQASIPINTIVTATSTSSVKAVIKMDNASSTPTVVDIHNIPLKRWFHLAVRMQNKIMDVYVNGTIAKRTTFENIPKQNFDDVRICPKNGDVTGFSGKLSNLRYFDSALNVFQITNITMAGPDLTSTDTTSDKRFDYLSSNWYGSASA